MWKLNFVLILMLGCCLVEKKSGVTEDPNVIHHKFWVDPYDQDRGLLGDLLKARRLSSEFDEPTRLQLDWVCRTTKSGDLRLALFMAEWPLDAIFPHMPFLKIWGAGCGTYESNDPHFRHTVLPLRIFFNLSKDVSK